MKHEGLTSAKFAEILSVQPSSISHLLSGRNKPNFDFLSKLFVMFPRLNPRWFINGEGEIYLDKVNNSEPLLDYNCNEAKSVSFETLDNHSNLTVTNVNSADLFGTSTQTNASASSGEGVVPESVLGVKKTESSINTTDGKKSVKEIVRVICFYEDNTFESFESF